MTSRVSAKDLIEPSLKKICDAAAGRKHVKLRHEAKVCQPLLLSATFTPSVYVGPDTASIPSCLLILRLRCSRCSTSLMRCWQRPQPPRQFAPGLMLLQTPAKQGRQQPPEQKVLRSQLRNPCAPPAPPRPSWAPYSLLGRTRRLHDTPGFLRRTLPTRQRLPAHLTASVSLPMAMQRQMQMQAFPCERRLMTSPLWMTAARQMPTAGMQKLSCLSQHLPATRAPPPCMQLQLSVSSHTS